MSVIPIMELFGFVAGIFAAVFFLFGRQRRMSRGNRALFAMLLITVIANAGIDLVEQTGEYRRLDLIEDYVDILMLFAWCTFAFSLFPQYSGESSKDGGAHRALTRQIAFVFSMLLVLNVIWSMSSFMSARNALAKVNDFHGPALLSVLEMRSRSNNAVQESFAYVISGEIVEKEEFEDYVQSFDQRAEAVQVLARLDDPNERNALAVYEEFLLSQSEFVDGARKMFVEFESSGKVSNQVFQDYERIIDKLDAGFERLEQAERSSYEKSQAIAIGLLEDTSFELPILGGTSVALCAGLFALLLWSFRQYSTEQEHARRELAESELRQRQISESLAQRDQAFRVAIMPIAFADLDGRITDANQAFADLFGFESTEQFIGQLNTDFHCEPISVAQINERILASGGFEGEVTSKRMDGTLIEVQISATLISGADGRPAGHMAAFMDVTPRRNIERSLRNSEQHYRTLVEAAPEAIVVLDIDEDRFVDFNESAMSLFRLDRDQLEQTGPIELSPEKQPDGRNSAQAAMEFIQRALEGETPIFEWLHCDSEGNEVPCEVRMTRLSSNRRLVRGSMTNITDRLALKDALSRRTLEAELLYQAVAMVDETDSLEEALQKCVDIVCELTRWPLGHAYVPSFDEKASNGVRQLESKPIWHSSDQQRFAKFCEVTERTPFAMGQGLPGRVWESGVPAWVVNVQSDRNFPRNLHCDDLGVKAGFAFPIKVRGETVAILEFYNEREVEKNETLLLLVRSVGEQVGRVIERKEAAEASRNRHQRVAEELEKAKTELIVKTRLAAIGQMSAQIAHELRNPLGAVSNAVFFLKRRVPASEVKWTEYLSLIDGEVATCNRFIRDLLDVTRGRVPNRTQTNLGDLIDRVIARHNIAKSVELQVVCQPNPFDIFADGEQIVQVIDNLLKNAIDAIGENAGRIEVRAHRSEENDIIIVRDTGCGMQTDDRSSAFDVLFTTKATGTGFGLPICRQIIERHGGTIDFIGESSPGTTIQVKLPRDHGAS